jgi:SNF2 family DNA or RNA helicase
MPDLFPFQQAGVDFLTSRGRAYLADEMGAGKSAQALVTTKRLGARQLVVCCPTFALATWEAEIAKWFPEMAPRIAVISGPKRDRDTGWERWAALGQVGALLTTFHHLGEVAERFPRFDMLVVDEAHHISNRRTKAFKAACRLKSRWLVMMSGTPTRKSPDELWTALRLIDPKRFPSYWRFVSQFFLLEDGRYGKEILGLKHPAAFRGEISRYLLRRLKRDVMTELPPLTRQQILVPLAPEAQRAYDQLAEELLLEFERDGSWELLTVANKLALMMRLRQLTVCPKLLGLDLPSSPLAAAVEIAESAGKVVVFTSFRQSIPYFVEAFRPLKRPMMQMHGEQTREENMAELARFQSAPSAVLFCSAAIGASWSANTASTCIFLGYGWSPIENQQCEARLHRNGQTAPVNCYYIGGKGTVDESIAAVIEGKVSLQEMVLDPKKFSKYDGR